MARIFLSYRRADGVASGARTLIYQKLSDHYGPKSVFMDVERMQVARDFRECLREELEKTDVVLALIGPEWTRIMQERAELEDDFVRIELESALAYEKPILPILLGGARMPGSDEVPASIQAFTFNHGVEIDTGRYFNEGVERLCQDMDEHLFVGHKVPKKKSGKGLLIGLTSVAVAVAGGLVVALSDQPAEAVSEAVQETTQAVEKVAEQTAEVVESAEEVAENTEQMAASLERIAKHFDELKNDGIIDKPAGAHEFYHNARLHELEGDYGNARRSYLGYFNYKEAKLDPHLRFTDMLKVQEGREGARETYAVIARQFGDAPENRLTGILLYKRETRVERLKQLLEEEPDYAPARYFLSLDYSADRLGARAIEDMREEKKQLEAFQKLDADGKLVRHFLDQAYVTEWRKDAERRLKALEAQMNESVLENPVSVSWMKHNAGWNGNVQVAEPITALLWKTAEMGDYKQTQMTDNRDPRTGKPMPQSWFTLPVKQPATTLEIKYLDRNGRERGPYAFDFQPQAQSWAGDIRILNMTATSWLMFRDYDGKLLLYFTHLMSYRGCIASIAYGLDVDVPNTDYPFPAWEEAGTATITEGVPVYLSVPKQTGFVTVQLTFKDGTKSEVQRFER